MLWSPARVQQDTKDSRIIVNLNRPAKMLSSSLFTLVLKFKKERRFDEVLAITAVSPLPWQWASRIHNLERATLTYSCQGVFTDHFIFSTVLARI